MLNTEDLRAQIASQPREASIAAVRQNREAISQKILSLQAEAQLQTELLLDLEGRPVPTQAGVSFSMGRVGEDTAATAERLRKRHAAIRDAIEPSTGQPIEMVELAQEIEAELARIGHPLPGSELVKPA